MNSDKFKPTPKNLSGFKRKGLDIKQQNLIKEAYLNNQEQLPVVVTPQIQGIDVLSWVYKHKDFISERLLKHGGVLFRNFNVSSVDDFNQFIRNTSNEVMNYHEGASPRTHIRGNIYTSTDYPAEYPILLHNELSYRHTFPLKIFFFCLLPAKEGGETLIADVRKVYEYISPQTRENFIQRGWKLVRNLGDGFGLSWQEVFHTEDKAIVKAYCLEHGIVFEWKDGDRLRTSHIRPAIASHPQTKETLWFNHATFFHISSLEPTARNALLKEFAEQDLPTNTYYGDGSPIEPEVLEELRAAYNRATIKFSWQVGDILMLDNMIVAHGRSSFTGQRKVLVGMSDPWSWDAM